MQKALWNRTPKRIILRTILLFLASYLVFLILWIQIKDGYGYGVTHIASNLVALIGDVRFEEVRERKGIMEVTFTRPVRRQGELLIDVPVKTSSYTFNAPLTFGIMAALFPFIKKRGRAYGEALLLLFGVHLLYVFSLEANSLASILTQRGLDGVSKTGLYFYQFLWEFTENMVIRFEPFLIGFYIFVRFRR